jgi:hypothetical protein
MDDTGFFDEVVLNPHFHDRLGAMGPPVASTSGRKVQEGSRDPTEDEINNLIMKFILFVPDDEKSSLIRIMFHVEQVRQTRVPLLYEYRSLLSTTRSVGDVKTFGSQKFCWGTGGQTGGVGSLRRHHHSLPLPSASPSNLLP